ncbi:MAG: glycerophosphodiester phosphodiesterase [Akkermansiaceae bacterium]
MLIIGHRGACALEPENTLRSFQRAIDLGVDMIELDIYQIEDQLIVIHDNTLDRTTTGTGLLTDHSFQQLRKLNAGKGAHIPTLTEVLDLTRGKVSLNIEIKGPSLVPLLHQTIQEENNILISSFDWPQLIEYRNLDSEIPIGILGKNGFPLAHKINATAIHPHLSELSPEYIQHAKKQNLQVYTYTIRTDADWLLAKSLNVDGCFVDDPSKYNCSKQQKQ